MTQFNTDLEDKHQELFLPDSCGCWLESCYSTEMAWTPYAPSYVTTDSQDRGPISDDGTLPAGRASGSAFGVMRIPRLTVYRVTSLVTMAMKIVQVGEQSNTFLFDSFFKTLELNVLLTTGKVVAR